MTDTKGETIQEEQPEFTEKAPEESTEDTQADHLEVSDAQDTNDQEGSTNGIAEKNVESLSLELEKTQDRLLRTAAEYQNFRRRNLEIREESIAFGRIHALEHLLDVYDDLTRTVDAIPPADEAPAETAFESLSQGVRLVQEKFTAQLKKLGVEPIETVGRPFDENLHEAVMQQPAPEGAEPGSVMIEVQRGYRMGERILRHAKVVVAGEPADA